MGAVREMRSDLPPFLEAKPCNLCGGSQFEEVVSYPPLHFDHRRYETAGWDGRQAIPLSVARCTACHLVMSRPSFREDALDLVYPGDLVPEPSDEELARHFDPTAHKFHEMARHVARHCQPGATVIDVGARYGVFAWILREQYGFEAHGLEMSPASVAFGRHRFAFLHEGTIADLQDVRRRAGIAAIDAFVLDDVVEHLVDPARDLRRLAEALAPSGRLFLRQMDHQSLGRRLFRREWYYYAPAAHMYYFDRTTLGRMLEATGYRVEAVYRPPPVLTIVKTLLKTLPQQVARSVRARRRRDGREHFLVHRFRSHDDMFVVVARRDDSSSAATEQSAEVRREERPDTAE